MEYYGVSDIGKVRKENQDVFSCCDLGSLQLFIVCDGMGGMSGGSVASKIAVEFFSAEFKRLCEEFISNNSSASLSLVLTSFLKKSLYFAVGKITERESADPTLEGMGTTLVACALYEGTMYAVNVGDSRLYRFSEGDISIVTKDHSLNRMLLDLGDPEGESGKGKNILTRSLGAHSNSDPDIFVTPLEEDDILILCSDGLYNPIENEISDIVSRIADLSAEQIANELLRRALSLDPSDNLTVLAVKCGENKYIS